MWNDTHNSQCAIVDIQVPSQAAMSTTTNMMIWRSKGRYRPQNDVNFSVRSSHSHCKEGWLLCRCLHWLGVLVSLKARLWYMDSKRELCGMLLISSSISTTSVLRLTLVSKPKKNTHNHASEVDLAPCESRQSRIPSTGRCRQDPPGTAPWLGSPKSSYCWLTWCTIVHWHCHRSRGRVKNNVRLIRYNANNDVSMLLMIANKEDLPDKVTEWYLKHKGIWRAVGSAVRPSMLGQLEGSRSR